MILVEVGEAIVEEDMRTDVIRDVEAQFANGRLNISARTVIYCGFVLRPLGFVASGRAVLEVGRRMASGNRRESRVGWGILRAVLVFDG